MTLTNKEAIKRIKEFALYHAISDLPHSAYTVEAFEMAIRALENQDRGVVSLGTYEQVRWERDVAISQLEELGYGFGEKIRDEDKKSGEIIDIDVYLELVKREIITDEDGHGYYIDANKCSTRASDFEPEQIEAMKNLGARYVCWSRNE